MPEPKETLTAGMDPAAGEAGEQEPSLASVKKGAELTPQELEDAPEQEVEVEAREEEKQPGEGVESVRDDAAPKTSVEKKEREISGPRYEMPP